MKYVMLHNKTNGSTIGKRCFLMGFPKDYIVMTNGTRELTVEVEGWQLEAS
jgi:hypothetical protein